jgi:predicted CXXCH cytochrome family protein
MRASLLVILAAAACATGRGGSGEPPRGGVPARFAGASRTYSQGRQRATAETEKCALPIAARSLTRADVCVGCHDNMLEPVHTQHAYWADYALAATSGRPLRLVEVPASGIVLVDGTMVSCTSCHDSGSPYPHHTALPLDRSALCVGCHRG